MPSKIWLLKDLERVIVLMNLAEYFICVILLEEVKTYPNNRYNKISFFFYFWNPLLINNKILINISYFSGNNPD